MTKIRSLTQAVRDDNAKSILAKRLAAFRLKMPVDIGVSFIENAHKRFKSSGSQYPNRHSRTHHGYDTNRYFLALTRIHQGASKLLCNDAQPLVTRPKFCPTNSCGGKQVNINVADAFAVQTVLI
jgi:hypothetical protein